MNTALVCNPQTLGVFQQMLIQATDNNCDAIITPIFADAYVQANNEGLSLDNCYILSGNIIGHIDEHLKKHQLNIITPLINQCVWKLPI